MQVELQQVCGDLQALASAEENALGGEQRGVLALFTVVGDVAAGGFSAALSLFAVAAVQKGQGE